MEIEASVIIGLPFIPMEIPDVINIKSISGLYAHTWRSHMSSMLCPYLGMPIGLYGHIVVINSHDLIKHWRSTHKDDYAILPFRAISESAIEVQTF